MDPFLTLKNKTRLHVPSEESRGKLSQKLIKKHIKPPANIDQFLDFIPAPAEDKFIYK